MTTNETEARDLAIAGVEHSNTFLAITITDGRPIYAAWFPGVVDRLAVIAYLDIVRGTLIDQMFEIPDE